MDPDFWRARWSEGRIGFHEGVPNVHLRKFVGELAGTRRVLVPLCGKSEDLAFLAAAGHEVWGVELVEDAVRAFFDEHGLEPEVTPRGKLTQYASGGVTLVAGDFFAFTAAEFGTFDGWYDRAALIALPAETRRRYVARLRTLLSPGARGLLVAVEYTEDRNDGPPFSVTEAQVCELFAGFSSRLLEDAAGGVGAKAIPVRERSFALQAPGRP